VDDIDKAPAISREIGDMLGNGLYHTMDWEELNHGLFTALKIQQIGMSIVLALVIVVAAFTVVATLVMVVLDKTKEIAVMKAMGATDGAVLRIFLYQGGIIGLMGTTLGLLLGLVVCKGLLVYGFPLDPKVYFISRLPVQVRFQDFLITGQAALAICLEATILPSLYAAEMSPADGFRDQGGGDTSSRKRHWLTSAWLFRIHYGATIVAIVVLMLVEVGTLSAWWLLAVALWGLRSLFALATLLWRRWGFYGLCIVHSIIAGLFLVAIFRVGGLGRSAVITCAVLAGVELLIPLLAFLGLRKRWRYLE
jgi:lipoprotein-releasing system permease protein